MRTSILLNFSAICLALLFTSVAVPGALLAQEAGGTQARDEEARSLFNAGRVAFADGRFEAALGYFERAHELSGRPQLLFNIGSAADRVRKNEQALEAFEGYLAALPEAANRRAVESRITVLKKAVAAEAERQQVPSPAEAALAAQATQAAPPAEPMKDEETSSGGIFSHWAFWTVVGVVAAGAVAGGVIAATSGGGTAPPTDGDNGLTFTLRQP